MAVATSFSRHIGAAVKDLGVSKKGSSSWFSPHMAAATRAILERIPLVDFTMEVLDARVPLSSTSEPVKQVTCSHKRIILLNKADLADRCQTEKWSKHFEERNCFCYTVNSHNKENIKGLLNFVRARTRELGVDETYTATFMLVGIPNVGKSAIVNAMHQIGRISAAEKGKLKHAVVTSQPGETKDIISYKIASHPNIYVLDTPGVLSPEISSAVSGSKLSLTGAIDDRLVGESELAGYFLSILNLGNEYKCWGNLNAMVNDACDHDQKIVVRSGSQNRRRKQYPSDHTQDYIVRDVRRTLFRTISSFEGNLQSETEMAELIESQFVALHEAFRVPLGSREDGYSTVAAKLLNLYRTGRLGSYTLDHVPIYSN